MKGMGVLQLHPPANLVGDAEHIQAAALHKALAKLPQRRGGGDVVVALVNMRLAVAHTRASMHDAVLQVRIGTRAKYAFAF